jgi:hypothetical protein
MPEFYDDGTCRYQLAAQPYLCAVARGVRDKPASRAFLLDGTKYAQAYAGAKPLWREQWSQRDPSDSMKCPFWSNYWYEPCGSCHCRIENSVSMEIDAMFFLQNIEGKRIAIHIEMKRDRESLSFGQPEAYRPRARCFRDQGRTRKGLLPHHDFVTVLFCGIGTDIPLMHRYFDRVISHERACGMFPNYPGASNSLFENRSTPARTRITAPQSPSAVGTNETGEDASILPKLGERRSSPPIHGAEFIMAKKDPTPVTLSFPADLVWFTPAMINIGVRGGQIPKEFGPAWQPFFKETRCFYRTEYRTPKGTLGRGCETAIAYDETPDANGQISITATKSGWLDVREVCPKELFKHGELFQKGG